MAKCANCGFLTFRHRETRQLVGVEDQIRTRGIIPNDPQGRQKMYEEVPLCFAMIYLLKDELTGNKDSPNPDEIIKVIGADRDCDSFTPWRQGFSPKEHQEMLDSQRLLTWQQEREQEDREWRQLQEERAEKRHRRELLILGGFVGISTIIGAVVGALMQRFV